MNRAAHCPVCGAPLPEGLLQGLCPRCVARQAEGILTARAGAVPVSQLSTPPLSTHLRYFGDYELLEEIARGGMGVVWKARQVSLNRIVAVKVLLAGQFSSPEFVQRFRAEAEAAANLQHPNIVAIHEVGEHEGHQYFSMDYVEGGNLSQLVRDQPLPARRAATYLKTVADAVHYAHQHGVLHRDLKPANILIDDNDQPRVTDFGLAKRVESKSELKVESKGTATGGVSQLSTQNPLNSLTLTGQVLGTPAFISPEQAGGKRGAASPASDVYSLGAVLYFLITGRAPFAAGSLEETLRQIHETEPVSPRLLNPALPRDLETICVKSLSKEPTRRYVSAQALGEDLGRFLNDESIEARPVGKPEKLWRWCRRKPALAITVAALCLVAAGGLTGIVWQWRRAEQHAARETVQRVRAEEAVTSLELQRAEDLLEKDEITMGVAYLARIVRQQPTNQIAARRLLAALTQRNFALPVGLPLQHAKTVNYAEFSPEGRRVVTAALDLTVRVWDTRTGEPLTAPMIHLDAVRSAHFSPDGGRLVTFTDDFRAHLWEAATGRALGQPMTHTRKIWSAQFSPDGRRVLTASEDGTARVWDAQTGEPAMAPLTHQGLVRWARFSPDGRHIATASRDKTVQVWDAATGLPVLKPLLHPAGVNGVEFSADGKRVVTAGTDMSTRVWEVTSGQPRNKPLLHVREIDTAKFSPEGERIVVALRNGTTRIFNARDWAPLTGPMQHRSWTPSVEFGPEAQRVLTGSHDHTARLWDADSGEPLTAPMQHDGMIWSARLSPDGLFAITASADGTARLWDVRLGAARSAPMSRHARVRAAEFSPDGEWVVTAAKDHTARIWNGRTGQQRGPELKHAGWVLAVAFSPDGERVATASADRTARIWDARTGQPLTESLRHDAPQDFVSLSPDGRCLATASKVSPIVRLWHARTGEPHGEPITLQSNVNFICFSPDGQRLLSSGNREDMAQIHDVTTGRLLAETPVREGRAVHGEFSPDGQRVLTASVDGTARIWNAQTLQPLTAPMRHKDRVAHVRFSRDGRWVVTASDDTTAQVWDARTSQPVGEPLRHRKDVNMAAFSPDGALVVTASDDGTTRLWDARTGRPVSEPFEHGGTVESARFSPDGRRVLTASESGARVWDVPPTIPLLDPRSSRGEEAPSRPGNNQSLLTSAATVEKDAAPGTLLADLAETVIGKRVNAQGAVENVSPAGLAQIRQRVTDLPHGADFTRWLEWFLADRSARAISPGSQVSLPDYALARAQETNEVSWREALMLCPTNGLAFAQMAKHHLQQSQSSNSVGFAQADWESGQAVKFAPWEGLAWHSRRRVLELTRQWKLLLDEAEEAIQAQSTNAVAWNAKAEALVEMGQTEAALGACDRALEMWATDKDRFWGVALQREILLRRSRAFRRLGRLAEASADLAEGFGLARRDPQTGTNLIDLGLFYNGGAHKGFPGSVQRLAGTDFDFRGWIHLDLSLVKPEITHLPERVNDIPIEQPCRRLHFLHTLVASNYRASNADGTQEEKFHVPLGAVVGRYVVHYADGQQADIPIIYGRDVRDWWHWPESAPDDSALIVAWTGSDTLSRQHGAMTRLYKTTWENPRPDVTVHHLDFVHARTHAVPVLVAITADLVWASTNLIDWVALSTNTLDFPHAIYFGDSESAHFPYRFYSLAPLAASTQLVRSNTPLVYSNSFEGPSAGPEWNAPRPVQTAPNGSRFLGELGNRLLTLTLSNLSEHTFLRLKFDLYVLRSWDGNRTIFGPDRWRSGVSGGLTLLDTTFSADPRMSQAYPGNLGASYPGRTGAAKVNTLGYTFKEGPVDMIYHLEFVLDHTKANVVFEFEGLNLQDIADESWGLDNVVVEAINVP